MSISPVAAAQVLLSESRVVELAREQGAGAMMARAQRAAAEATVRGAGAWPNPSVSWQREALGAGGPVQDTLQLTVPLALARPGVERSLAASEGELRRADAAVDEASSIGQALAVYFGVVVSEGSIRLLLEELSSLEEAGRVLDRRTDAGSASGYERARLMLELESSRSRLELERARLAAGRAKLAALLNLPSAEFRVEPRISLPPVADPEQVVSHALSARRHLVHARRSLAEAKGARRNAGWLWVPDLAVSGGMNIVRDGDRRYGYTAGVAVDVPLFSHGQDVKGRADAQHAMAAARVSILERQIRSEVAEARASYEAVRAEVERFRAAATSQAELMVKAARTGYREGARSVVELLDAERAYAQAAHTELALLATGKEAELRLRMATGQW